MALVNITNANRVINSHGLPYKCVNQTPGDGNCFFHAISENFSTDRMLSTISPTIQRIVRDPHELRNALCKFCISAEFLESDFMINVNTYLISHYGEDVNIESTWLQLVLDMTTDGCWAYDIFIEAMAKFLNKNIFVISQNGTYTIGGNWNNPAVDPPVTIVHLPDHFQSAQKVDLPETFVDNDDKNILEKSCRGCNKSFKNLNLHLTRMPRCRQYYSPRELENAAKARRILRKKKYYETKKPSTRQKEFSDIEQDCDKEHQKAQKKKENKAYYQKNAAKIKGKQRASFVNANEKTRFLKFYRSVQEGLSYTCICCHRLCFRSGVKQAVPGRQTFFPSVEHQIQFLREKMNARKVNFFENCIKLPLLPSMIKHNKVWLCITCTVYISKDEMPKLCYFNGLQTDSVPDELMLNDLEVTLIAKKILFIKMFQLPKSRWKGFKDKVVNVPIDDEDLLQTINRLQSFPRNPDDSGLIPVQLKRKLKYKSRVLEKYISIPKLIEAIRKLQQLGHPGYQNITLHHGLTSQTNETSDTSSDSNSSSCSSASEELADNIKRHQFQISSSSMLTNKYPESTLVLNETPNRIAKKTRQSSSKSVPIAPGEGKVPTSLMRDVNWDVDAYPNLHPTGKFGLRHQRDKKLATYQYFMQRLQNVDKRWSNDSSYVFAAVHFTEREQFESKINISFQRGTRIGNTIVGLEDAFSVFDKMPSTPRFWQQKRHEVVAKLEQLGPFQFFFTLSCADKRWPENFASILHQKGLDISFKQKLLAQNEEEFELDDILVNGEPLEQFLDNENLHDLVKDNVLTVTRNFDHRVHEFMKHIVMGPNNPMHVEYYNYRVEFQMRGAGHIHGVLWLDMDTIEKAFPGLQEVMKNLAGIKVLDQEEQETVVQFVDSFITCSLENDVSDIVQDVQIHHHSKTCQKHGDNCRFNYPKFPSEKTIIAQPLERQNFVSEDAYKKELKARKQVLTNVKAIIQSIAMEDLENWSLEDILKEANVSKACYYKALSTSMTGTSIVLKRKPKELYVNNYNIEWIRAWDGNMDLQICLDYFAIVTYITDYYMKEETGVMEILKEAAKQCKDKSSQEQSRHLVQTFLTHRQMGECEAYYRLFPHLHLSESNVVCIFVATGFKENRSRFLVKAKQSSKEKVVEEEETLDGNLGNLLTIEGREGEFLEATSIHDKYEARPDALEDITLAQFAIMYKATPSNVAKKKQYSNGVVGESDDYHILSWDLNQEKPLPQYISLRNNLGYMSLRKFPAVLRVHKHKRENASEYIFSELLLFRPWRSEEELFPQDFEASFNLFSEEASVFPQPQSKIDVIKMKIFPHKNNIEEARATVQNLPDQRVHHIGDTIDPTNEQENADLITEGFVEDDDFAARDPGDDFKTPQSYFSDTCSEKFRRIDISNKSNMLKSARSLDKEQRLAFDCIIKYAKQLRASMSNPSIRRPAPPLIKVHGGAGCGKSKLIQDMSSWAEYWLRYGGNRDPGHPFVVKVAPTGLAAHVIEGMTLHSAFHFQFGNKHVSLSDKVRDTMQNQLSELCILIVDEMSMVKSDLLYQLFLRLQEIKQNLDPFGGVCTVLCGDLMQLQPVMANWIFQPPRGLQFQSSHELDPLWEKFSAIELKENHRQGKDKTYADILNRIRLGHQTAEDIQLLKSRITSTVPENAVFVYGTNALVQERNENELTNQIGTLVELKATNVHSNIRNFKPKVSKDGTVNDTPFLNVLKLKKGARVMLTFNVDTTDGLTNGTTGKIVSFITKVGTETTNPNLIFAVLVQLDDTKSGKNAQEKNRMLLKKYVNKNVTPIFRIPFEYSLGQAKKHHSAKAKVFQFPLKLAWALTSHKIQGQTIKPPTNLVADINSVFDFAQTYVILGRVQSIDQLHLLNFSENKIRVNNDAYTECQKISKEADLFKLQRNFLSYGEEKLIRFQIAALNIQCIGKVTSNGYVAGHMEDVYADPAFSNMHVISLSETWLEKRACKPKHKDFHCYTANAGKGKGVAVFVKKNVEYNASAVKCLTTAVYQVVCIEFCMFVLISVYRSPSDNTHESIKQFTKDILSVVPNHKSCIIIGDFNIPYNVNKPDDNYFSYIMLQKSFKQIVTEATHIKGHILDHCYIRARFNSKYSLHYPYYSDHEATILTLSN